MQFHFREADFAKDRDFDDYEDIDRCALLQLFIIFLLILKFVDNTLEKTWTTGITWAMRRTGTSMIQRLMFSKGIQAIHLLVHKWNYSPTTVYGTCSNGILHGALGILHALASKWTIDFH